MDDPSLLSACTPISQYCNLDSPSQQAGRTEGAAWGNDE